MQIEHVISLLPSSVPQVQSPALIRDSLLARQDPRWAQSHHKTVDVGSLRIRHARDGQTGHSIGQGDMQQGGGSDCRYNDQGWSCRED